MKPKRFASLYDELMERKDLSYENLFSKWVWTDQYTMTKKLNHQRLSKEAERLVNGAYTELTGMLLHVNNYYLAESMTEAICCAEYLKL